MNKGAFLNGLRILFVIVLVFTSCSKSNTINTESEDDVQEFISAVDISRFPEISSSNTKFYDSNGNSSNFLDILKQSGINTIRLRLWVNPSNVHSGFDEVQKFSKELKTKGFKIWLTLHYSDTWADPSQQKIPANWMGLNFSEMKDRVYDYTRQVVENLQPEYIQIGNEINTGFLHPMGHITDNYNQFSTLMSSGIKAVRDHSKSTKIIIHFAGIENALWFYNQVKILDYDIIGLSYYPIWHGKSLNQLASTMNQLANEHDKKILIAETAYPFTLGWNDWTNNIVGLDSHLILPDYPASPEGQQLFIRKIKKLSSEVKKGIGFCYWGAELVAWKGTQATDASPWENQALFDFSNKALPVLEEF
ncbi:glycoside hydrolase family 53 protein [Tenacibaculum aiptasiae]|uniref:glycoside hydrolase family 53 protein n=1 Tax=Tenacibaculum aiptasiae TaxID=426481 RepID=UPI00232BB359|nr:glycosyl hydrolase 53 family protein [Tenacibaculum aiptasiae]